MAGRSYLDEMIRFSEGSMTFDEWRAAIDKVVQRLTGFVCDDLPDWHYAEAFSDGVEPCCAAHDLLEDTVGGEFQSCSHIGEAA
jgi:hypothetical protein